MGISMEDAIKAVDFPLTKKRIRSMLSQDKNVHIVSFKKDPFYISDDEDFSVGLE